MSQSIETVKADFDRIALLSGDDWNHNHHYHDFLLQHLPPHCQNALDVGCGAGAFSRRLAARSAQVVGVDLSPQMIRMAQAQSVSYPNLKFQCGDFLSMELSPESYDCISSIATLHHLPMEEVLPKLKAALRPDGILLILDLFEARSLAEFLLSACALPVNLILRLCKTGKLFEAPEVKAAWAEHGKTDSYLPLSQVRSLCSDHLPGAIITTHLLWRYSIVWRKL